MSDVVDALSKEVAEAVAVITDATALLVLLAQQSGGAAQDPIKLAELTRQLDAAVTPLGEVIARIKSGAAPL